MKKKFTIYHMNKSFTTSHYIQIDDEKCDKIRKEYNQKPLEIDVENQLKNIHKGKVQCYHIVNFYFRNLMDKVKLKSARWSISEMMENNDLISYYYSRVMSNQKIYPPKRNFISNFKTALSISGGRVSLRPSNFPLKTVHHILSKYNVNNNYYDFCCGWGVRLLGSLYHNINYYGTDTNNILVDKLNKLYIDYKHINNTNSHAEIVCKGSEHYNKEWKNKFGLIFSSPPYYDLEDYKIGYQSIYDQDKNIKSYEEWFNDYMKPTLENCIQYLIKDGFLAINIKNTIGYNMYDDVFHYLNNNGNLLFITKETLKNIKRPNKLNTDESIMIFQHK